MEFVLLQAVFLPLLLSPVAYIIGRNYGPTPATWFTFGLLLYCSVILINASLGGTYEEHYPWTTMFGEFGFLLDGLATPFAIIIYVLCTVLALYSKPYMVHKFEELFKEHYHQNTTTDGQTTAVVDSVALKTYVNRQSGLYFAMFLVFAMGMLGTVLSTNLIEFYIFFEVMLIPSFFLVAFYGDGNRRRIALQFLFWTHVGAVVLLLGFLAIGLSVGSFDFVDIVEAEIDPDILVVSAVAIILGLGVKLAAFVFHVWLPYAHGAAPPPISALLSPAMIGIGAYGLFRLIVEFLPQTYGDISIMLNIWGVVTMFYGGAMALLQDDFKRMLAYSSISQMGYLLFAIGSFSTYGLAGAEMMYISHGLGKGLLFMTAGVIIVQVGTRSFKKLGGLASKMPITAVCAVIGGLTIMGIPPTSGFMGEWMVFYGALETAVSEGNDIRSLMFALGLIATALTMSYILWMLKRVFFGKLPENLQNVKEGSWYMLAPMMVLAGFTIVVGIYPDVFLGQIMPYMQGVMGV